MFGTREEAALRFRKFVDAAKGDVNIVYEALKHIKNPTDKQILEFIKMKKTNWLDEQLKEAKEDWKKLPQWIKDCSRTQEFKNSLKNNNISKTFTITEDQQTKIDKWHKSHSRKYGKNHTYEYIFGQNNGIGIVSVVRCIVCNKELDITDYDEW